MYLAVIMLPMLALPLLATVLELAVVGGAPAAVALGWFVVFGIGVRLLLAGLKQMAQPDFTARLLDIADPRARVVIRELGFANTSIALLALLSVVSPAFTVPAAVTGALFFGLAGLQHATVKARNGKETIAMVSDLALAVVLAALLLARIG